MHFLGATTIEDKIFDNYVRWVEKHHPDAPVPPLYRDKELFENAQSHREALGDSKFFDQLNVTKSTTARKVGKLARSWDGSSFDQIIASTDEVGRGKLFSALVRTHFPAFAREGGKFINLDQGLEVMAAHAKALGYEGVVLYLDELILWLASNASDLKLIERETQKLVNLKEGEHDSREIPIVSFVARQRDLSQLVGDRVRGDERAALEDNLKHNKGRFEEVKLEDSNLPAIIRHRVLNPKNDGAKEILEDGFAKAWRDAGQAKSTLIGSEGDETAFRQVYPFSPALVEALVAMSNFLQRERTAIRILMQLLVEHLPELELGPIVPMGDAFDVIAGGEDPFDQVMRTRFNRARHLYAEGFLPIIRADHGTDSPGKCQRDDPNHRKQLGCSGCPERACRNDNRLAKTLLMAALAPGAPTFEGMTVRRLVHLNHGVIASRIPGGEIQNAAEKLRRWKCDVDALRIGDQGDPEISLHLEGIDLKPIIDKARLEYDNAGSRKHTLRKLLFAELKLPPDATTTEHKIEYRGVKRSGMVRFANVREMADKQLRCPAGAEWYLVIDYPFDPDGSPQDDLQRIDKFRETVSDEPSVFWLPTFFSSNLENALGDYIAIDHILDGRTKEYLGDLRPEDQTQARDDLKSRRDTKRSEIVRALGAAYGMLQSDDAERELDLSRKVDEHLVALSPAVRLGPSLAGSLADGMDQAIKRLIEQRFPNHPRFPTTVTAAKLNRVNQLVERVLEAPDHRMPVTAQDRKELQSYSDPLGLTTTTESAAILEERVLNEMEQLRQQAGVQVPTVLDVRNYSDPDGNKGLTPELQDLLVWLYAQWSGRAIMMAGRDVPHGKFGQLPEDAELIRPELPTEEEWQKALAQSGELFGISFPNRHLSARNLAGLNTRLSEAIGNVSQAKDLPGILSDRLSDWGDDGNAPRKRTAQSAVELVALLTESSGSKRISALAVYAPETSPVAVARSLKTCGEALTGLRNEARWLNFSSVQSQLSNPRKKERAQHILDDLAALLAADELNAPLSAGLAELTSRAAELLKPAARNWADIHSRQIELTDVDSFESQLAEVAKEFVERAKVASDGAELKLEVSLSLLKRRGEDE
ncbi:hypothetical protein ACFL6C_05080 [Myxococcota bacterium]